MGRFDDDTPTGRDTAVGSNPDGDDSTPHLPPRLVVYAATLESAGVHVVHDHEPAMPHGFLSLTAAVDVADTVLDRVADALQRDI